MSAAASGSVSGFKVVAFKAVGDVDRKMLLKKHCKDNGLSFPNMWRMEKKKKASKMKAIRTNTWRSRLSSVHNIEDPMPTYVPMIAPTKVIVSNVPKGYVVEAVVYSNGGWVARMVPSADAPAAEMQYAMCILMVSTTSKSVVYDVPKKFSAGVMTDLGGNCVSILSVDYT